VRCNRLRGVCDKRRALLTAPEVSDVWSSVNVGGAGTTVRVGLYGRAGRNCRQRGRDRNRSERRRIVRRLGLRRDSESVNLPNPAHQWVPTGENLGHHPSLALRASYGWQATPHDPPGWLLRHKRAHRERRMVSTVAAQPRRWTARIIQILPMAASARGPRLVHRSAKPRRWKVDDAIQPAARLAESAYL
jgi:hypothetical protein